MQAGFRIAAIGELLWDFLPGGPQLGGAPANFAAMCAHLAAADSTVPADEILLVSRVGDDPLGRQALEQLAAARVKPDHVSIDPSHPTGTVSVEITSDGSPIYRIHDDVAWDYIPETSELATVPPILDAVCFGTLAQRSPTTRNTLRRTVEATSSRSLRVFDVNLRDRYWTPDMVAWGCAHASILKMNHEEVPRIARALDASAEEQPMLETARFLLRQFPIELVAITRGRNGSLLVTRNATHDHPGVAADVMDLVGAGDAFTAALTFSVLRRLPLPLVAETANRWGAWAATQRGGMPRLEEASIMKANIPHSGD